MLDGDEDRVVLVVDDRAAGLGAGRDGLVLARLDGDRSPAAVEVIPTMLVQRGSGEIPPAAPPA